jgi:hypothetical protein
MQSADGARTLEPGQIRFGLEQRYNRVWGFHVYRYTYKDEEKWSRFLKLWDEKTHKCLAHGNNLDLLESMDMRCHEDQPTLDSASIDQVRQEFKKWLTSEECKSESEGLKERNYGSRYIFCVYVDEDVLESMVGEVPEGKKAHPYYILIDSWWG